MKATVSGVTTAFIGAHFEWTGSTSTMTKSYYAGTQRIALRTGGSANTNLKWLLGDHLGSTSVTADYAGTLISRTLYKPLHSIQGRLWGEVRYQSGALPTKYTYTGQYSHTADFGLMYYVARWYDPVLGRFIQPDSIVPEPFNPMDWDRYAYTRNNPVKYIDPDGHNPLLFVIGLMGAFIFFSQVPSDQVQTDPANHGDPGVMLFGFTLMTVPPVVEYACLNDGDCLNEAQAVAQAVGDPKDKLDAVAKTAESVTNKLANYLLNKQHSGDGASKAQWFEQALGYTKDNMSDLAKQIVFDPAKATPTALTDYGQKYEQWITITGANGKTIDVLFVWIKNLDGVVRLVTGIPTKK